MAHAIARLTSFDTEPVLRAAVVCALALVVRLAS